MEHFVFISVMIAVTTLTM